MDAEVRTHTFLTMIIEEKCTAVFQIEFSEIKLLHPKLV
jgi:hypothetical protein